jgi:hypothetical protein
MKWAEEMNSSHRICNRFRSAANDASGLKFTIFASPLQTDKTMFAACSPPSAQPYFPSKANKYLRKKGAVPQVWNSPQLIDLQQPC